MKIQGPSMMKNQVMINRLLRARNDRGTKNDRQMMSTYKISMENKVYEMER